MRGIDSEYGQVLFISGRAKIFLDSRLEGNDAKQSDRYAMSRQPILKLFKFFHWVPVK